MCATFVEQNQRHISVEKAKEFEKFVEEFPTMIQPEIGKLTKDFSTVVDRCLSVPANVPLYFNLDLEERQKPQPDLLPELEENLQTLQKVFKQQKILQDILTNELNFARDTLDHEADIDAELAKLAEHFMQNPNTDHIKNIENVMRNHDLK